MLSSRQVLWNINELLCMEFDSTIHKKGNELTHRMHDCRASTNFLEIFFKFDFLLNLWCWKSCNWSLKKLILYILSLMVLRSYEFWISNEFESIVFKYYKIGFPKGPWVLFERDCKGFHISFGHSWRMNLDRSNIYSKFAYLALCKLLVLALFKAWKTLGFENSTWMEHIQQRVAISDCLLIINHHLVTIRKVGIDLEAQSVCKWAIFH